MGPFYPIGTAPRDYLKLYATVFDIVEVDSSFYRIPQRGMVAGWRRATPEGFRFTAKFPKIITHENRLRNIERPLQWFYSSFEELGPKLEAYVVQLPPSIKYERDFAALEDFLALLKEDVQHAVEFRHNSWFRDDVYALMERYGVALTWAETQYLTTPPKLTADIIYLRMIGDRSLRQLGELQKDRSEEMGVWNDHIRGAVEDVRRAYVFFNNHYAGFGPGSVNEFRRLMGLIAKEFPHSGQKTLAEF
ncbi:MAG: DUF72 domain-containing protein [Thermoplasmata archaeon]